MKSEDPVAMVRCRLDPNQENSEIRFIPASEFDLWRHLMESKYSRTVVVEDVSVWVPEKAEVWDDGIDADQLAAVVRLRFEKAGPRGTVIPVIRYLATETYREARAALLKHFDLKVRWSVEVTPGYFVAGVSTLADAVDSGDETRAGEEEQGDRA